LIREKSDFVVSLDEPARGEVRGWLSSLNESSLQRLENPDEAQLRSLGAFAAAIVLIAAAAVVLNYFQARAI